MGKTYLMKQDLTDFLAPDVREMEFELHAKGRRDTLFYQGRIIKEMKANYSVRVVNRYCRLWLAAKKEGKMIVDKMPSACEPENPHHTLNIMTYELGSVVRAMVKAKVKAKMGEGEATLKAYNTEARIGLADLIMQCRFLAEQMNWKWIDLENDGWERFQERMKDYV